MSKKIKLNCLSANDEYYEIEVESKRVVCDRCDGDGHHTNPNIDGNGLSANDIDELGGPEFMEDYMSGKYDVICEQCHGNKVIDEPDYELLDGTQVMEDHNRWLEEEGRTYWETEGERRMGA